MSRANYQIIEDNEKVLCIRDTGPWDRFQTVTNDIEAVVEELAPKLEGRPLHYIDSDGNRDLVVVEHGKFKAFGGPVK